MHQLVTCDDVFEILTRGPSPTNAAIEDAEVESHLHVCHDCRQMAEALRPAAGLLRDGLCEDGLPVFQGAVFTSHAAGDRRAAPPWIEPDTVQPSSHGPMWMMHAVRLAGAAMLIGLLLGAIQLVAWVRGGEPTAIELREQLSTASMPPQCRLALLKGSAVGAAKESCCSSCHSAAVAVNTAAPMHRLVATSCRSCHE